jgi:F-type H+-transporting ATPase subunit gamma
MPSLKDLKNRIKSVKSTQKITKAMKMVAASKLRRAREQAEAARPYSLAMERMLESLAASMDEGSAPKLMAGTGSTATQLIIVATADRGLCGAFNSSIVRAVRKKVRELLAQGVNVKMICVGRKGYEQLYQEFGKCILSRGEVTKGRRLAYSDAESVAQDVIARFNRGEFDTCHVVYNRFKSVISQEVTFQQIIPFHAPETSAKEAANSVHAVYEYEPEEGDILADLLPRNIGVQIYHAMLENSASFYGSQMTAMDNATRNAGEMIKKLTLKYNRTRQAAITKELIEIISGAEAV